MYFCLISLFGFKGLHENSQTDKYDATNYIKRKLQVQDYPLHTPRSSQSCVSLRSPLVTICPHQRAVILNKM